MAITQEPATGHAPTTGTLPPPPVAPTVGMGSRTARMVLAGGALAVCGAAAAYTYAFSPNDPTSVYPQCWLKLATGVDCPGCGGLRATHALLHGDLAAAVDHNVLALVIVPLGLYFLVRFALQQVNVRLPGLTMKAWHGWVVMAVTLVFTVARNTSLPVAEFLNSAAS